MNLILLPGNSKSDKVWVDRVDGAFQGIFPHTAVLYYDHWWNGDEESEIDLDAELLKLTATVQEFDKYVIFAKSAGVLLTLYGIFEGVLDPEVCIFVGTPVLWGKERGYDIDNWLTNYHVPTLFIQQESDPAMSAKDLDELLISKNVIDYRLHEIPGNDHKYDDVEKLKELSLEFYEL